MGRADSDNVWSVIVSRDGEALAFGGGGDIADETVAADTLQFSESISCCSFSCLNPLFDDGLRCGCPSCSTKQFDECACTSCFLFIPALVC